MTTPDPWDLLDPGLVLADVHRLEPFTSQRAILALVSRTDPGQPVVGATTLWKRPPI